MSKGCIPPKKLYRRSLQDVKRILDHTDQDIWDAAWLIHSKVCTNLAQMRFAGRNCYPHLLETLFRDL